MNVRPAQRVERRVQPYHFLLWATEERHGHGGARGYPSTSSTHRPSKRRGDADDGEAPRALPTPNDHRIAEVVAEVIAGIMGREDNLDARILRAFHGAYGGASDEKWRRIAEVRRLCNCGEALAYRKVREAERYVAGAVEQLING